MQEYMQDSQGRLVPAEHVQEIDKLRDQLVKQLYTQAKQLEKQLKEYKEKAYQDINSFVELSAEKYNTTYGGKKGNITLTSYDGKIKINISVNEYISFDEKLLIAKELIDKCIKKWTDGARTELKALIEDAFYVDKQGKINTQRILGLRRLAINDPDWKKAMEIISDAVQVTSSKTYIRIYEKQKEEYKKISLDLASV